MISRTKVTTIFECSLERAFRTPILCDISKVHTGYLFSPRVTHCTDDEDWGKPGSCKKVFFAPSLTQKGGEGSTDRVIERIENKYWKIEVGNFKTATLGFTKFVGEWETTEISPGKIRIDYTYTMHSRYALLYPLNWLFTKIFWRVYMKHVIENIRRLADAKEPYQFA